MNETLSVQEREREKWQAAADVLTVNVEQFRENALQSCYAYSKQDRRMVEAIETETIVGYTFFALWQDKLRIQGQLLRSKTESVPFIRTLMRDLQLSDAVARQKAREIIDYRYNEMVDEMLTDLYGDKGFISQRKAARKIIARNDTDIDALYERYILHMIYTQIAAQTNTAVFDPHASWNKRRRAAASIKRENRRLLISENERLEAINRQLHKLCTQNDKLVSLVNDTHVDIISIIAARSEYEKRVAKLSKGDLKNPVKRMDIFAQVTKKLREEYGTRTNATRVRSLQGARQAVLDIDHVLVRVFDLSNTQKNQLMVQMKEFRDLTKEKDLIVRGQADRASVSKRSL